MENILKAVLLDDDPAANELLVGLLAEYHPEVTVLGAHVRADEALLCIAEHTPNLLFLDIEMPGKTGFEFFKLLNKLDVALLPVLVSAHLPQYYQEALDMELTLYLEKPVSGADLNAVINKANHRLREGKYMKGIPALNVLDVKRKVVLTTARGILYVYPEEVLYCKADRKCTDVCVKGMGMIKVMKGITDLHKLLNDDNIFKPDKSWLLNLSYLKEIHEHSERLVIRSDEITHEITITADGFANLKQHIKKLRLNI